MKKLLTILGSVSVVMSSASSIMAMSPNISTKALQLDYSTDSFKNIIKIINTKYNNSENMNNSKIDALLDTIVPSYYYKYINGKDNANEGEVMTWNSKPRNDTKIVKSYQNEYKNPDSLPQKCLTQGRTEKVEETHNFSISLSEKITVGFENKVEGSISLPLGMGGIKQSIKFNFGAEVGSEQKWSDSKTTSVEETIPSQEIMQNPHTILHVKYTITQGTWDYNGIARFKITNLIEKAFNIPFFYFDQKGNFDYVVWNKYSVKDIVNVLNEMGYAKELDSNQTDKYSVLSVDDITNPVKAFVNLPVTWNSPETSGITLDHYEEPYYGEKI